MIVSVKLITKEEIVGRLIEHTDEYVKLGNVLQYSMRRDRNLEYEVCGWPWVLTNPEADITIDSSFIIVCIEVNKEAEQKYIEYIHGQSYAAVIGDV